MVKAVREGWGFSYGKGRTDNGDLRHTIVGSDT
jgi:hypothetical protein